MSCKININNLSKKDRENIDKDLIIKIEDKFNSFIKYIYPYEYDESNETIYLPFAYAYQKLNRTRPPRDLFSSISVKFEGELREEQKIIKKEAIDILNKTGSVCLALKTGGGKTAISINLAHSIKLRTLIIVNKIVLMNQWRDSIIKFCPSAKVGKLTTKSEPEFINENDFLIMNAINVPKMSRDFFQDIGLLIIDESHLIMAQTLFLSLQKIQPRYLIGLSATPYRPDGLDILLDIFFGSYKIVRKLWHKHIAYVINTKFKPKIEMTANGKLNWGVVLDSLSNNTERNELIIKIIKEHPDRVFLVVVKRVEQGEYLLKRLIEEGETTTSLIGSKQIFDKEARILVGTSSKVGIGFDHDKLDALLMATDIQEYFIQYLGRVFRTEEVRPIIFDIVDDHGILKKHFLTRRQVYLESGGEIKKLDM